MKKKAVSRIKKIAPILLKSTLAILVVSVICLIIWITSFFYNFKSLKLSHENQDNSKGVVTDITGLYPIQTKGVIVPHTDEEIRQAILTHNRVSIGGGRYSMGGQTASSNAVQIDMREFNKIISLSTTTKEITVQTGIRWRDIQDYIDQYNLSIQIMQTYSNFTVGGSLSVNVHGRYVGLGPLVMSVKKIKVVLANGQIVEATPEIHKDIFYSAIGGLGGVGVITEATLALADNVNVERTRITMPTSEYKDYFFNNIRNSTSTIFHNGDIYPMDMDTISAVSWNVTDKPVTTESRLVPRKQDYIFEKIAWTIMSEWPFGKKIRQYILEPYFVYGNSAVHTRNYEASYDVAELEPKDRSKTTYVLQEYFIPVEKFNEFYPKMKEVFIKNDVNILNVSIRHAKQDPGTMMAWAKSEVFAFVIYYKQGTDEKSKDQVGRWTREMVDQILLVGGSYYLPYQPQATKSQFLRAYPNAPDFFELKKKYDPTNKFTNNLWDKYYNPEQMAELKTDSDANRVSADVVEYVRPSDTMYLSIPEWYIVYSAGEYANVLRDTLPSKFDYIYAIKEYWNQYDKVVKLATGTKNKNSDYRLVLNIIGCSFTFENSAKFIYENSIGVWTEMISGNTQVEEDIFAAKVARDYEKFIYDYPWYDFPYNNYYKELRDLKGLRTKHTIGQNIRRFERQKFLGFELKFKHVYSSIISAATHSKFGVQDDIISAVIKEGESYELISAPHYHPFTKKILERFEKAFAEGKNPEIVQIAGNDEITISYVDEENGVPLKVSKELFRNKETVGFANGHPLLQDRVSAQISVRDLFNVYKELKGRGVSISHLYDY